jgi:cell division protease FtsH
VRRLITTAEETATRLLTENRQALDVIAERLLDIETIEGDELRAMLQQPAAAGASTPA